MNRNQIFLPTLRTSRHGDLVEEVEEEVGVTGAVLVLVEEVLEVLEAPHLVLQLQQAAKLPPPAAEPRPPP